jgi:hypothetical protein
MATVLTATERRAALRCPAARFGIAVPAVLRPGMTVQVVELSAGGALVESRTPVRPNARTELSLDGVDGRRHAVRARVLRCWVSALEPLTYRCAVTFEQAFRRA